MILPLIRRFHTNVALKSDFSHVVVGGGIIGTSIASRLQSLGNNNVLLIDKNDHLGLETTSRNSEVIHAGLYYPKDSLKAQLCIEGKHKIYNVLDKGMFSSVQVPIKKCGKFIVAQDDEEQEYLEKLHNHAKELNVETEFVSKKSFDSKYPLLKAEKSVLLSPTTGIISVHDFTLYYQTQFENNEGTMGLRTELTDINFNSATANYSLECFDHNAGEPFEITTDSVINCGGLYAPHISNLLLPPDRHITPYFAKGTYFTFQPETPLNQAITDKLVYPVPNPNAASLGTHLTFDMGGQIKFGPDLEWLDIENANQINYTPNEYNLLAAYEQIKRYFPKITMNDLSASYTGVRPKVVSRIENKLKFADFIIREEEAFPGFINLLGIESPGVTASWAISDYVKDILYR